jgi:ubiquinone/menaquinone biosynthesis C-methylase UbiE
MKKEYYQLDRVEMLDFVQMKPTTCLDVGCGEGNFGKVLKQHFGSEVWGIEPVESAAQVAAQKLDNVIHDFFHEELLPDHHFDLISFNDVLDTRFHTQHSLFS